MARKKNEENLHRRKKKKSGGKTAVLAVFLIAVLVAALALANAALLRDETCGCHVRTDCPDADENEKKYRILLSRAADGGMSVRRAPV